MNKLLIIVVCLMLLLCACGAEPETVAPEEPPAAVVEPPPGKISVATVVDAVVVNIRLQASADSRILNTARRGEMFRVLETSKDGAWCRVSVGGDAAYISADYLYISEFYADDEIVLGTVAKTDAVNVRSAPSPDADLVLSAIKNEQFVITAIDYVAGWHQVEHKGQPAYVSSEYIQLKDCLVSDVLR